MTGRSLKKWISLLLVLALFYLSALFLGIDPGYFIKRSSHLGDIAGKLIPPDWNYAGNIIKPLLATIQMSVTGTSLGAFFALVFAPLCSKTTGFPNWLRGFLKLLIQIVRSFPALILALAATFIFGLGTFAGTAAIMVYTFAIMARLTYEDIESAPQGAYRALRSMGAGKYKAFVRAIIPEIGSSYLSNALYMLESNVRQSAILGYVGAGGLGLLINEKVSWREYEKVGMILIMLFAAVCIIEWTSHFLTAVVRNEKNIGEKGKKIIISVFALVFLICTFTINAPDFSHTSVTVLRNMFLGFIQPNPELITDLSKAGLAYLLLETICISLAGTLLGAVIAFPLAVLNTSKLVPKPVSLLFRLVVMVIRSVPFIIYGIIFVRVTGQGAFTGVLTIAVCSVGLITKRFTEAIDSLDFRAGDALKNMGIPGILRLRYAILPQLWPSLASAVLYRFDVNIREASILGLVGAGGIGTPLLFAMNHYDWKSAGAISLGLIVIVLLIDILSTKLRNKLA